MTGDDVVDLANDYAELLYCKFGDRSQPLWLKEERNPEATDTQGRVQHLYWMCLQTARLAWEGRIEKAMRWLGFIQGSFWLLGLSTIEQMKKDNSPTGAVFDKERV